jgi:hypothetical protein
LDIGHQYCRLGRVVFGGFEIGVGTVTFSRRCVVCTELIPEDRLRKGKITCKPECHRADRKGYIPYRKALKREEIISSPWFRKQVRLAVAQREQCSREAVKVVSEELSNAGRPVVNGSNAGEDTSKPPYGV